MHSNKHYTVTAGHQGARAQVVLVHYLFIALSRPFPVECFNRTRLTFLILNFECHPKANLCCDKNSNLVCCSRNAKHYPLCDHRLPGAKVSLFCKASKRSTAGNWLTTSGVSRSFSTRATSVLLLNVWFYYLSLQRYINRINMFMAHL